MLRNASAMTAEREALRMGIEHLTVLFPTEVSSFDFQVENSGGTVQYKLNAQSLRLFGLHSDVSDAHRAGANRLHNKQNLHKEIQGTPLSPPCWEHCMSYECRETNIWIKAACWNAHNNPEHRMMHWLQLVSLANSRPSSSSSSELTKDQRELADIRNEVRQRSRTPLPKGERQRRSSSTGHHKRTTAFPSSSCLQNEDPRALRKGAKRKASKEKARAAKPQPEEPRGTFLTCFKIPVSELS